MQAFAATACSVQRLATAGRKLHTWRTLVLIRDSRGRPRRLRVVVLLHVEVVEVVHVLRRAPNLLQVRLRLLPVDLRGLLARLIMIGHSSELRPLQLVLRLLLLATLRVLRPLLLLVALAQLSVSRRARVNRGVRLDVDGEVQ